MASPAESEQRLTVADDMALDDDQRCELIDGALVTAVAPNIVHQRVFTRLCTALDAWVETNGLGVALVAPVDVVLSDHTVLRPDLLFVRADR